MKLSQKQIAALWVSEGGNPAKADEASAVAMAESGGDTTIHTPGSCCWGLYQFHQDYFPVKCAKQARCATRMAIKLSENGKEWEGGRWEAHENGAYLQFVGKSGFPTDKKAADAKAKSILQGSFGGGPLSAVGDVPGDIAGAASDVVSKPLGALEGIAAGIKALVKLIEDLFTARFWIRAGKGIIGFVLILFALNGMAKALLGQDFAGLATSAALAKI